MSNTPANEDLVLTEQVVIDLTVGAIEGYLICLEEGMSHEEALDTMQKEAAEDLVCLRGECGH